MNETIIEALTSYFSVCPILDGWLNVQYLPEDTKRDGVEYSIDSTPATLVVKNYVDGSSIRQYLFVIRSVEDYSPGTLQNIANSGKYEKLAQWLDEQTIKGNLPQLPEGQTPQTIKAQSTGYLFTASPDAGKYQIQCALQYYQKGI